MHHRQRAQLVGVGQGGRRLLLTSLQLLSVQAPWHRHIQLAGPGVSRDHQAGSARSRHAAHLPAQALAAA